MGHDGRKSDWGWFAAWVVVGAMVAFGLLSFVGLFVLPVAVLATLALTRNPASLSWVRGLVAGLGLPLLYIAYINRNGPGDVCRSTQTSNTCTSETSPWPWLAIGLVLIAAGFGFFLTRHHHSLQPRAGNRS